MRHLLKLALLLLDLATELALSASLVHLVLNTLVVVASTVVAASWRQALLAGRRVGGAVDTLRHLGAQRREPFALRAGPGAR